MGSQVMITEIIARAEECAEFKQFCSDFDSWNIQCWLQPREKALHFGVGAFFCKNPVSVELGTFEGASALFTMAGMRHQGGGMLYPIDPHLGAPPFLGSAPYQFTLRKFRDNMNKAGLSLYQKTIVSDSQIASSIWPAQLLDTLLIDADHSYTGCLRDIECWGVKLRPGGLMLIDDADDPALPELQVLIEDIKGLDGLSFEALIDGVAVFRRADTDGFALLDEIRRLPHLPRHRPWDMAYIQDLVTEPGYAPETLADGPLQTAYQLGYLARCEAGDYAVTRRTPQSDVALVDALIKAKGVGEKVVADRAEPPQGPYRMAVCSIEEAAAFRDALLPGGVLIARSALPATPENAVAERRRLIEAGFDGCGWSQQIHWGFARPHLLSIEAIMEYIQRSMR